MRKIHFEKKEFKLLKIGIVYFSQTDITHRLIEAFTERVKELECEIVNHRISGSDIIDGRFVNNDIFPYFHECDAIVFGSPTYMGGVAAQFKAFADATSDFWQAQTWSGKLAAGITSGTGLNGDQGFTLGYMQVLAGQHGMLWVNMDSPFNSPLKNVNRLGCHAGVVAESFDGSVNEVDINTAKYLAEKLVSYALKMNG